MDVINQQAKFGREADFKLGTDQEIAAKVCASSYVLWIFCKDFHCSAILPEIFPFASKCCLACLLGIGRATQSQEFG